MLNQALKGVCLAIYLVALAGLVVDLPFGLVPAAISTGIGSQVQQPLACVIVGGMLLSPICSLLVIPTLARLVLPDVRETRGEPAPEH